MYKAANFKEWLEAAGRIHWPRRGQIPVEFDSTLEAWRTLASLKHTCDFCRCAGPAIAMGRQSFHKNRCLHRAASCLTGRWHFVCETRRRLHAKGSLETSRNLLLVNNHSEGPAIALTIPPVIPYTTHPSPACTSCIGPIQPALAATRQHCPCYYRPSIFF